MRRFSPILDFLLMNAAVLGKVGAIRCLIACGADPNAVDRTMMGVCLVDEEGQVIQTEPPRQSLTTVLMGAALANRPAVVRLLIERGADVNARDADGKTALVSATIGESREALQVLLTSGADVDARDHAGRTALGWARHLDKVSVIPLLLEAGAKE
jgi:ankyrin repeat protein